MRSRGCCDWSLAPITDTSQRQLLFIHRKTHYSSITLAQVTTKRRRRRLGAWHVISINDTCVLTAHNEFCSTVLIDRNLSVHFMHAPIGVVSAFTTKSIIYTKRIVGAQTAQNKTTYSFLFPKFFVVIMLYSDLKPFLASRTRSQISSEMHGGLIQSSRTTLRAGKVMT